MSSRLIKGYFKIVLQLLLLFFTVSVITSCAKKDVTSVKTIFIGSTEIRVELISRSPAREHIFLQLHDNEQTSAITAHRMVQASGGSFLRIENNHLRNITFRLDNALYAFDPNRIFSSPGIKKTLEENGQYDEAVEEEVNRFADSLLSMLRDKVIVALHNNSNGRYSVRKYLDDLKSNAAAVHINEVMDEDDFIYTTSNELFIALRHLNINVVLQDHEQVEDDGSLSVYCGRNQIVYVNVETEHGHEEEQYRLTKVVLNLLSRPLINK